jgi:hypothetical protein
MGTTSLLLEDEDEPPHPKTKNADKLTNTRIINILLTGNLRSDDRSLII